MFLLALLLTLTSFADPAPIRGYKGTLEFSDFEKAQHLAAIGTVTRASAACLQRHHDEQEEFWQTWKISRYYGMESDWNRKWTQEQKEALFNRMQVPLEEMKKMKVTNCTLMTLACLEEGFRAARQDAFWDRLSAFIDENNKSGTAIQLALQRLGWRVLYWNPDTTQAAAWDAEEKARDDKIREGNEPENQFKFFGYHAERLRTVRQKGMYLYNPVDDFTSLIDYQRTPPEKFMKLPFFVGTAHSGFHVFPGKSGWVIEAHNKSRPTERRTIEAGWFDTLNPREPHPNGGVYGLYRSGLIAVPPGYGY